MSSRAMDPCAVVFSKHQSSVDCGLGQQEGTKNTANSSALRHDRDDWPDARRADAAGTRRGVIKVYSQH